MFAHLDRDHDGFLSAEELAGKRQKLVARFDTNGDGKLSRDELTSGLARNGRKQGAGAGPNDHEHAGSIGAPSASQADPRLRATHLLSRFDRNADGFITADELPTKRRKLIGRFDVNRDGKLSEQELEQGLAAQQAKHLGKAGDDAKD